MKTAMTFLLAVIVLALPVAAVQQKADPTAPGRQASAREGAAARQAGTRLRNRRTPARRPRGAKRRDRDTFFGLLRVGRFVTISSATASVGYSLRVYSPQQRQRLIEENANYEADRQREAALSEKAARGDEIARRELAELRSRQSPRSRSRLLLGPNSLYEISKLGPDYVVLLRNDRELIISAPWIRSISRVVDRQPESATEDATSEATGAAPGDAAPGGGAAAALSPQESDHLTEVLHLQSLIAREVSGTVSKLFAPEKVRIVADPKTNSLIVRGSRQDLDRVMQVVRLLEGRKAAGDE